MRTVMNMTIMLLAIMSSSLGATEITFPKSHLQLSTTDGNAHQFDVEVAISAAQRMQGLMHREAIPEGTGMLFDYRSPRPLAMWMKNTALPLDILFADENGVVFQIVEQATPFSLERIRSTRPARYVLELPGGTVMRKHIKPGARITTKPIRDD